MHRRSIRSGRQILLALTAVLSAPTASCDRPRAPMRATAGQWQTFEGSWNAAGARRTIHFGDRRTSSAIDLRGALLLSGNGRPGVGFHVELVALADSATGLTGRGVWTDERGDQVFSELKGEGTRDNNRVEGTFVGGTGRYANASGGYEFSWQYVIESDDASIQGRSMGFKGRFRIDESPTPGGSQ